MTGLLYFLFFCSGLSGLIYQVVWVRVFGNVFGNTIYSASLVIAVFMLGLGVGSYAVGAWADRRYAAERESLLRAYGYFELLIAAFGLGISMLLPHLGQISALVSSYSREPNGWYALSTTSILAHAGIVVVLLTPITLLMGGTLTLLIRHLVRHDFAAGGWRIAVLYAVNTAGAALGCFLTDFVLVPASGLRTTQLVAVMCNVIAGLGGLWLVRLKPDTTADTGVQLKPDTTAGVRTIVGSVRLQADRRTLGVGGQADQRAFAITLTSLALALTGFAGMGMEILWFRHFSILLGEFRAVFSLLLTIILIGIGAGSLAGGFLHRRAARPAQWLIAVQGLFVASTLLGLATASVEQIKGAILAHSAYQVGRVVESGWARAFVELWFNARPILLEVGVPALLMGFAFPLANGVIQRAESSVGRRAGVLYLSNTVGAVCGSLAAGFLLLPMLGIQGSATILMIAAALAVVPLYLVGSGRLQPAFSPPKGGHYDGVAPYKAGGRGWLRAALAASLIVSGGALALWLLLPSDYVITRALVLPVDKARLLTLSEGITEVIAVTEVPGEGRLLLTNGHPMSSTSLLSQRYMRGLAHIPLLSIENPETVLVMCFGVGNTAHAATLHPSVRHVEVVDLSRHVLAHSSYFTDTNGDVLNDRRVAVYVNDGRHHLQMQRETSYDLITLEPPPTMQAGVGALYSREFYALARTRLKPKGYISQWLPVAQVREATTLAMIRAFVEVFPQAVLVSGAHTNLLLIGANDSRIEIDPNRVAKALSKAPAVQADLQRVDLGSIREIVGTFVASAGTLADASRDSTAVSDDRPLQEYSVRSLLSFDDRPPTSIVDVSQVARWCPRCFVEGKPVPLVDGLDTYLALLNLVYKAPPDEVPRARTPANGPRVIAGSAYLGAIVPESADLHTLLGSALAARGNVEEAIAEFRDALRLEPNNGQTRYDLATTLLQSRQYEDAADQFRAALRLMPNFVKAHNNLGVTLASQGRLDDAIDQFQKALTLQPEFADARTNLTAALQQRQQPAKSGAR